MKPRRTPSTPRRAGRSAWPLAALLAVLAGCGGGGGSDPAGAPGTTPTPPTTPVAAAPTILVQPADVQAVAATSAEFRVSADGTDLQFQWQRSSDGGASWTAVAGATQDRLALPAVEAAQSGALYRVLVSRAGASTTSTAARLTVLAAVAPPVLAVSPQPAQVIAGATAQLSVTATGTGLRFRWQWSSDGSAWTDIAGADSATLVLSAVDQAFNGRLYRVVVSNDAGEVSSAPVSLAVTPAGSLPVFASAPQPIAVTAPGTARFSATVRGDPAPQLQWQRSSDGTTWVNIEAATAASYTTPATTLADNGTRYRLVAQNATGTVISDPVTLTVTAALTAPSFTEQPADQSVQAGATVTWSALAQGNPQPSYQWQISTDGGVSFANVNGATQASFGRTASAGDNGLRVRVVVSNTQGATTSRVATLAVSAPASALAGRTWDAGLQWGSVSGVQATALLPIARIDDRGHLATLFTRLATSGSLQGELWAVHATPGAAGGAGTANPPVLLHSGAGMPIAALSASPAGNLVASWMRVAPCPDKPRDDCFFAYAARYLVATGQWESAWSLGGITVLRPPIARINDAGDVVLLAVASDSGVSSVFSRAVGATNWRIQPLYTLDLNDPLAIVTAPMAVDIGLDAQGRWVVGGQRMNASFSSDVIAWRGDARTGSLAGPQVVDGRAAPASFRGLWVGTQGQAALMWSQNNGSQDSQFVATLDTPDGAWSAVDTGAAWNANASFAGTVTDSGDFLLYHWTRCTLLRRTGGTWRGEVALPSGSCNGLVSPDSAVARNGNAMLVRAASGQWATIDAGRMEVVSPFRASTDPAGLVLGTSWRTMPAQVHLSSSGVAAVVSFNAYSSLPSPTSPLGDSPGGPNTFFWTLFFR